MFKIILPIVAVAALMLALGLAPQSSSGSNAAQAATTTAKLRVGTYDNRGIMMAWFRSEFNDMDDVIQEQRRAQEAGDENAAAKVIKLQQRFHFMGFGRAPVSDLLENVADQLPELAKRLGVDVIAFDCNYTGDAVEVIDITLELAELFDPSPETLKTVRDVMKHDPVALEELTDHDH